MILERLWRNFLALLKASRIPNLLIISIAQLLTSWFILHETPDFRLALLVLSTLMVASGGYIINDYYDQKIDMINRPEKVVVGISLRRRHALMWHSFVSISGIVVGLFLPCKVYCLLR